MAATMNTNGQHRDYPPVSFDDAAVIARLTAIAVIEGDRQALTDIAARRPDLDVRLLELVAEVAVAVTDAITNRETL